eukprot:TRINITY_DN10271_c0_g1_i1.p4 TRINITY_DN10271_c0_g1~~TRINITY_DN10271_c0_g1_i1.p4  ORF type:complete len:113 (+),score=6.03 TRINITY_DN10271_c0_g1_i1:217-555(+)
MYNMPKLFKQTNQCDKNRTRQFFAIACDINWNIETAILRHRIKRVQLKDRQYRERATGFASFSNGPKVTFRRNPRNKNDDNAHFDAWHAFNQEQIKLEEDYEQTWRQSFEDF